MHRLRSFGLVDLRDAGGRELLPAATGSTALTLLAYLAVARPAGPHDRDKIATLFWPDTTPADSAAELDVVRNQLAVRLGEDALTGTGDGSIGLDPERCWCDAAAFRTALDAGRTADALELYRGDFLQGFNVSSAGVRRWIKAERSVLRRQAAQGARQLADQYESCGRLTSAVTWAKRCLELRSEDERVLRRLLRLLDRTGDRKMALRVYERFSRRLRDDFARDPAPLTTELVARIRRAGSASHQPGSARVPAAGLPPEPPKEHRI
jgi:DNA-binding SARP family transcriptional activator